MMFRRGVKVDVTLPEEGDDFSAAIPVEEIRRYSVGSVPIPVLLAHGVARVWSRPDTEVRVAAVKVDGAWVDL